MSSEDLAPADAEVVTTLVRGLSAYGRLYGLPNSPDQVQGILGTLLRLYRPQMPVPLVDALAQQVLDDLTLDDLTQAIVNRATSALAKDAYRWQQQLEQRLQNILAAYVQRHGPALTPETLRTAIAAALPLLGDRPYGLGTDSRPLTRAEVIGLIDHLAQTFDPERAIASEIDPVCGSLAETLAKALAQQPMTQAVKETVIAYVNQYAPAVAPIGADLIATALGAVLRNQVDFNIDPQLTLIDQALLIEQVSFQLNILQQSPLPHIPQVGASASVIPLYYTGDSAKYRSTTPWGARSYVLCRYGWWLRNVGPTLEGYWCDRRSAQHRRRAIPARPQ